MLQACFGVGDLDEFLIVGGVLSGGGDALVRSLFVYISPIANLDHLDNKFLVFY